MLDIIGNLNSWFGDHRVINTLLSLMILDILCGVFVSIGKGTLSSSASWKGMSKKAITLLIILTAAALQTIAGDSVPLIKVVAGFYCVTEAISILENAAAAGVPLPKALVDILIKLKQDAVQKTATIAVSPPVVVVTPRSNENHNENTAVNPSSPQPPRV